MMKLKDLIPEGKQPLKEGKNEEVINSLKKPMADLYQAISALEEAAYKVEDILHKARANAEDRRDERDWSNAYHEQKALIYQFHKSQLDRALSYVMKHVKFIEGRK